MFRTRDFLLLIVAVMGLVVAIGTTMVLQKSGSIAEVSTVILADSSVDTEYTAEVSESKELLPREGRLLEMRQKIAAGGQLTIEIPEPVTEEAADILPDSDENQEASSDKGNVLLCAGYTPYGDGWRADGISVEIVEGSRVFYRTIEQDIVAIPNAGVTSPDGYRVAVLQLPIQSFLTTASNCLTSDVVGIAHDGSLIRNSEVGLYGVFGEGTMIGYALDGHSIYGVSEASLDSCGGRMVSGEYRYYLSDERETILNCFVSVPAAL